MATVDELREALIEAALAHAKHTTELCKPWIGTGPPNESAATTKMLVEALAALPESSTVYAH